MSFATAVILLLFVAIAAITSVVSMSLGSVSSGSMAIDLAVMLDMIGTQIYGYFKSSPGCRGFGSGAGKRIQCFDCVNDVPCVGCWGHA